MISIIIPVWNHFKELKKCFATLKTQTDKDFEVIVVDDASDLDIRQQKFDTGEINIKFFRLDQNTGGNAARNRGFKESKGEYVVFVDADLGLREDFLEKLLEALKQNPQASYSYPSFRYGRKNFPLYEFDAVKMKKENYVPIASLIRREHFPGFDESLHRFQDWDLWLTMLEQNHTGVWVPLYLYRALIRRGTKSSWLPRITYKLPFIFPKRKQAYQQAKHVVMKKHGLI